MSYPSIGVVTVKTLLYRFKSKNGLNQLLVISDLDTRQSNRLLRTGRCLLLKGVTDDGTIIVG